MSRELTLAEMSNDQLLYKHAFYACQETVNGPQTDAGKQHSKLRDDVAREILMRLNGAKAAKGETKPASGETKSASDETEDATAGKKNKAK
jgi:hypothetical protein